MTRADEVARLGIDKFLETYREKELLRLLTCGSVDDGKSTLIGRLLHDTGQVFEDQLEAAKRDTKRFGTTGEELDFALLLDGLEAEREQGITIDVAHYYYATERRKFIIADTPGHEQYTRNMATGASNCALAIILVDARRGVLEQTRRHSFIVSLLGIRHVVFAVNKMDLVDFDQKVFDDIRSECSDFAAKLQATDVHFIPISALRGDNVAERSESMPWYGGSTLLDLLETVHIASDRNLIDLRFPVQYVIRPDLNFRGFGGTVESGIIRRGDEVVAIPSGKKSRVKSIVTFDGELEEAFAPMSVTVALEDEIDVSRGDMLVHPANASKLDNSIEAMVVWMSDARLEVGGSYLIKQTTVQTPATVTELSYRMDVNTLRREDAKDLGLNEIGRISLETMRPLAFDAYAKNRHTGAFILIDRLTNATLGAGMIVDRRSAEATLEGRTARARDAGRHIRSQLSKVSIEDRSKRLGHQPVTIWLTGLPRSGKSSIAFALEKALFDLGHGVHVLDGENLRGGINRDLGFSGADRFENQRRCAEVARLCNDVGLISIAALVSPLSADRAEARRIVGEARFVEVFCSAPLDVCESRDGHGLYARARAGEITNVTGVDAPYEAPASAELVLDTVKHSLDESVEAILVHLRDNGIIPA